ncbi:transporter substrate-binding domain-containing protein [Pseudomonas aeruginosa]|uniref:ATP-binding protein n=1 Tax=Pseudomonas TaxID=286 RepID=UPI0006936975|nr:MULTISPECIES: transporter substrate-binding domain-containing protein [Pseudomonas]KSS22058.1 two-component system sensor histidine kinase/response regulator [Pseudomonas aeruginosa]MDI3798801.1 transporter substrate-binding domain-containing protein [Pseudomonas aeruginosa]OFR50298.1 two-component system sensor histidine kinase/response regulator [Pseudomonas sp. HMSC066A08]QMX79480.1 transporter substrate-binding domain-containing protein [Pseudomonas aeruginosa]RPP82977.1 two-component s
MRVTVRRALAFLVMFLASTTASQAQQPAINLFGRIASTTRPWLTDMDRQWLAKRGPLRFGVSAPDYPPLELLSANHLQGITADYLELLFDQSVQIVRLPSREAALQALRQGEIDLLGSSTPVEAADSKMVLSELYLPDQPVLVSTLEAPFTQRQAGIRLAIPPGYLKESQVTAAYPGSRLFLYESTKRALEALALDEVDAALGDVVSSNYLINTNYWVNLKIRSFAPIESRGFGFLLRPGDTWLRDYLARAVPAVSAQYGDSILRSWSGGRSIRLSDSRIALTPRENGWLAEHPSVRVVLNGSLGALGQFTQNGKAVGIGPDYLELISQRSGLRFEYLQARNYAELDEAMAKGSALLSPVMSPSSGLPRSIELLPPYLQSSVIVLSAKSASITDREEQVHHLAELEGKKVAVVSGYFLEKEIRTHHPRIKLAVYPTLLRALRSVDEGTSDVFVGSDYAARFVVTQRLENRLKVTGVLDAYNRPVSLAVQAREQELRSILEKAQLSITPEEISELIRKWEPRYITIRGSFWRDHLHTILQIGAIALVLVLFSLVWGLYLTRQIHRTRLAEQKADAANQAKSTFLSTMSHEIRTPLSAVIGLQELALQRAEQGTMDKESLLAAQSAAQGLLLLIGNVLDLSRIESGHIDSTPRPVALKAMMEEIAELATSLARQKKLTLDSEYHGDVEQWVTVDPLHLKQITFNLLSNAIKFTEQGGVTMRLSGNQTPRHLHVQLDVIDTGIGISAEDCSRLFQPFSQVESAQRGQAYGSGLGLNITQRLVEHLKGHITLQSEPGKGSHFSVTLELPLATPPEALPEPPAPQERSSDETPLKILVADDHPFNRIVLEGQLAQLGHAVTLSEDGLEAWEQWKTGRFDLLVTDGHMPKMNGFDLVAHIRAEERASGRKPCRIIALTASAEEAMVERFRKAGADEVLFKPVSLEILGRTLRNG